MLWPSVISYRWFQRSRHINGVFLEHEFMAHHDSLGRCEVTAKLNLNSICLLLIVPLVSVADPWNMRIFKSRIVLAGSNR